MRTLISALAVAVVVTLGAFAQESPDKGPATGDPTANSTSPSPYLGCVVRSGGKIMLTDANNKDYVLVSSGRSLDSYVGQEVQLSAITMNPSDPSSNEHGISAEQPRGPMTLEVENIRKVSEKCSSPQTPDKKK